MEDITIYAIYTDKGPVGACGQGCSTTNPRRQLHIFHDYEEFRLWCREVEGITHRKSPKLEDYYMDDGISESIIKHRDR